METLNSYAEKTMTGFMRYAATTGYRRIIDYDILEIRDSPRLLIAALILNPSAFKKMRAMRAELSMAMGMNHDQMVDLTWSHGAVVRVEIPKPEYLTFVLNASRLPSGSVPVIGLDMSMRPVRVDFTEPLQAHVLIAGQTGSGKTALEKTLVQGLLRRQPSEARFVVIDVAKHGLHWEDLNGTEHLAHPVVTDVDEALAVITYVCQELDDRAVTRDVQRFRFFVVIDELSDLLETGHRERFIERLSHIARIGREYGVHLILATQYPTIAALGTSVIKRQSGVRLVGKMDDGIAAKNATGMDDSGAQHLTGPGDFIMITEGDRRRFQAALPGMFTSPTTEDPSRLPVAELLTLNEIPTASPGRPPKPLNYGAVAQLLVKASGIDFEPKMTTVGKWTKPSMGPERAERHWVVALEVLKSLEGLGFEVSESHEHTENGNETV